MATGPSRLPRPPADAAPLRLKVFWFPPPLIVVVVPAGVLATFRVAPLEPFLPRLTTRLLTPGLPPPKVTLPPAAKPRPVTS